jgi:hypothetical protein
MRKILIIGLAIICAGVAFGQKTVVVYVTGGSDTNIRKVVGSKLQQAIINNGQYDAVERTESILAEIRKEESYQHSGVVDDELIGRLGKDLGADYVCVAELVYVFSSTYINAKLVDTEKKKAIKFADVEGEIKNMSSLVKMSEELATQLLGKGGSSGGGSIGGEGKPGSYSKTYSNGTAWNPDGIEMIYVEGTRNGSFSIADFYIGKYEVTQTQWTSIMGNNPAEFSGSNNPVENVSWKDVQLFIERLNAKTGTNYRLPTAAEWECAAREGRGNKSDYSGNNSIQMVAWYADNSGDATHRVGTKSPNAIGIYDMSGNVAEWCQDCYDSGCAYRVFRGGSWVDDAEDCRVAERNRNAPTARSIIVGFRLACSPK